MINNLQLLRGLATLGVVFYHTNIGAFGVHTDFKGVAIFFVISGFLMVYVTREDASDFFLKRVIRIVPFYWLLTLAAWGLFKLGISNIILLATDPYQYMRQAGYTLAHMDWSAQFQALASSLLFIPTGHHPILGVGWTLNIEMFFYALFALALLISRAFAPLIVATVLAALFLLSHTGDYGPVVATWGHNYVAFFVFGMGLFYLLPLLPKSRIVAIVLGVMLLAYWPYASLFQFGYAAHYLAPAGVVLAALMLDAAGMTMRTQPVLLFGAASYSLYLSHPILLEMQRITSAVWPSLTLSTPSGAAIAVASSCVAAVLLYRYVELPLIDACRRRVRAYRTRLAPIYP